VGIDFDGPIIVGKFVDIERPTFLDPHEGVYQKLVTPEPKSRKETVQAKS